MISEINLFEGKEMITLKDLKKTDNNGENIEISEEDKKVMVKRFRDAGLFETLDDDGIYYMILIFFLVWIQENENERLWKDFKEDIKYKSRFFPKSELLKKVDNVSDYASLELSKGTLLYRAREYTEAYFFKNREVIAFYQKLNEFFPHLKLQLEDIGSESAMKLLSFAFAGETNKMEELCQKVKEIVNEERPFWGLQESDCDAPPKEYAKAGRANSAGISFLYAASDKKTAIMEMRPQIGQIGRAHV